SIDFNIVRKVYYDLVHDQGPDDWPFNALAEIIKLARECDDWVVLDYFYREYIRKYIKGDISKLWSKASGKEWPTELAIEMIKLARELGDRETLEYFSRGYLRDYLRTGRL